METPVGYPILGPRVDFGLADGSTELTAALPVRGPGCVWVGAPASSAIAPEGVSVAVTTDSATAAPSCLRVEEGSQASLPLRLRIDRTANGTASGTIPISVAPLDGLDKSRTVDVPYTADLHKPFQTTNFLLVLITALLLGPGIPLGLLYLAKWLTARIPDRGLYAKRIPVTVEHGRVLRDGASFGLTSSDFVQLLPIGRGGARRLEAAGVGLRTRTGWSPLGRGVVMVEAPGYAAASSSDRKTHGKRLAAHLPLAVHNTWVLLHDPTGPADRAEVLVLMGADASELQRDDLAADVAAEVPSMLPSLRAEATRLGGDRSGTSSPPSPSDPSWPQSWPEQSWSQQSWSQQPGSQQSGSPQSWPEQSWPPPADATRGPGGGTTSGWDADSGPGPASEGDSPTVRSRPSPASDERGDSRYGPASGPPPSPFDFT